MSCLSLCRCSYTVVIDGRPFVFVSSVWDDAPRPLKAGDEVFISYMANTPAVTAFLNLGFIPEELLTHATWICSTDCPVFCWCYTASMLQNHALHHLPMRRDIAANHMRYVFCQSDIACVLSFRYIMSGCWVVYVRYWHRPDEKLSMIRTFFTHDLIPDHDLTLLSSWVSFTPQQLLQRSKLARSATGYAMHGTYKWSKSGSRNVHYWTYSCIVHSVSTAVWPKRNNQYCLGAPRGTATTTPTYAYTAMLHASSSYKTW